MQVVEGTPVVYEKGPFAFHNCQTCGSRLWAEYAPAPDIRLLVAATLDDTSWIRPVAHLWTKSAQPWVSFNEDAKLFDEGPKGADGAQELIDLWDSREQPN